MSEICLPYLRHRSNPEQAPEGFMQGVDFYEAMTPEEDRPLVKEFFQLEAQKLRLMFPPDEKLQGSGPFESREE
jgi:hypothetical protein